MTRAELKAMAKQQIKGNIGMYFLCALIAAVICIIFNFVPIVGFVLNFLFTAPIALGFAKLQLGMTKGEKVTIPGVFEGFNDFGKSIILNFLIGIFTFLWTLLLIVPGIIKTLSYSMSFYIMAENPEMTALEALNASKKMMKGHKWDLFVLQLSFILWYILGAVTLGFAYIYIVPYKSVTIADYYNSIKPESFDDFMKTEL